MFKGVYALSLFVAAVSMMELFGCLDVAHTIFVVVRGSLHFSGSRLHETERTEKKRKRLNSDILNAEKNVKP